MPINPYICIMRSLITFILVFCVLSLVYVMILGVNTKIFSIMVLITMCCYGYWKYKIKL